MMKHNMKKIISLVLVLAMSLAISVPGFAAEKQVVQKPLVQTVSSKAMASGKTYGPWFGSSTYSYNTKNAYKYTIAIGTVVLDAISPLLGVYAQSAAAALTGTVAYINLDTNDYTYGTVQKRYREVYINGEFAYFQTEMTTKAYYNLNGVNHYLGTDVRYAESSAPLVVKD